MYREYILNTGTVLHSDTATFTIQPPQTVYAFRVISVNFLQNWDSTNSTNNKLLFAENGDSSARIATIPPGNYHSSNITSAIATAMTSVGTQPYTCTYDDITRRLTISTSGSKNFKVLGAQKGTTSYLQLGISRGQETGMNTQHVMENPLNLSAITTHFVDKQNIARWK
ncbi:hypothetical protein DFS34DRAFT_674834 [Phlyctochytrium arcticum]|nr:hypothetical protein DFS34DRAFT_674834 [Phlyctochytrium arcticum]